jgi:hypothetical protein
MIMRINQMIPANGWAAVFENGSSTALPLVAWALGSYDAGEEVTHGMFGVITENGELMPAPLKKGFKSYDFDSDGTLVDFEMSHDG